MIELSTDTLLDTLKSKGVGANIQEETGQIYFGFNAHNEQFAIFMRVFDKSQLLQILVFLPVQFEEKTAGETARVLHWINQAIDLPGFGMEEGSKTLFFRIMLPAVGMQFDENLLEPFLAATKGVCETFYPAIKDVAQEGKSYQDVVDKFGAIQSDA